MENSFKIIQKKIEIIIYYLQIVQMPYPEFTGFTKGEVEDLISIVKDHGDVEYSGKQTILDSSFNKIFRSSHRFGRRDLKKK